MAASFFRTVRERAAMRLAGTLRRLHRGEDGAMAIETAIVAPVLILLAIGSFQVSSMVARQNELQSAAAEVASMVLAAPPESSVELAQIKTALVNSTGLDSADVTVRFEYRCNMANARVTDPDSCDPDAPIWTYVAVNMSTQYRPLWTRLGVGAPVTLRVNRSMETS